MFCSVINKSSDAALMNGLEFGPKFPCSDSSEQMQETKIGNFVYYKVTMVTIITMVTMVAIITKAVCLLMYKIETIVVSSNLLQVDCPCIGEWTLKIPQPLANKWAFKVKT